MSISSAAGANMGLRPQQGLMGGSRSGIHSQGSGILATAGTARCCWAGPMRVARSPSCLAVARLGASSFGACRKAMLQSRVRPQYGQRSSRALTVEPKAMVNVDFASPSLVLGALLIACGVVLLQMRNMQTTVSRDADIVVAAMVSIVGSTLIFQGWRLDPLLLLCQALTTSVAVFYGIETFRLRSRAEQGDQPPGTTTAGPYGPAGSSSMLPPQQQQGGRNNLVSTFTGGRQASQQQQAGLYGQRGQSVGPGGFLPPAQEQPVYPWVEGQQSPVMQYSQRYSQESELVPQGQPQGLAPAATWPSSSTIGQYNTGTEAPYMSTNTNTYYDQGSGQYYEYPQEQQYYGYSQQGGSGVLPVDAVQVQYSGDGGYAATQQPTGLLPPPDSSTSAQFGTWSGNMSTAPAGVYQPRAAAQAQEYQVGAVAAYASEMRVGATMASSPEAVPQPQGSSQPGTAGPPTVVAPLSPTRQTVTERVDDWE